MFIYQFNKTQIHPLDHGCTLAGLKLNQLNFLLTWFVIIHMDFIKRLLGLFLSTKLLYTNVTKPFWNFLFCIQGALRFAYTVLPCAGGTDPGRSQRGNQVDLRIHICTCNTNMSIMLVSSVNSFAAVIQYIVWSNLLYQSFSNHCLFNVKHTA